MTQLLSYIITVCFNKPIIQHDQFILKLLQKGFKNKILEQGFLISKNNNKNNSNASMTSNVLNEDSLLEGDYCIVIPPKSGTNEIILCYSNKNTKTITSATILRELRLVLNHFYKECAVSSNDISSCRFESLVHENTPHNFSSIIYNENNLNNVSFFTNMEIIKKQNTIYAYSKNVNFDSGYTPIIEDIKNKKFVSQTEISQKGWEAIILIPKLDGCDVKMLYHSNSVDELLQKFAEIEQIVLNLIREILGDFHEGVGNEL